MAISCSMTLQTLRAVEGIKQGKIHGYQSHIKKYHTHMLCKDEKLLQVLCKRGHLDEALDVLFSISTCPSDATYISLLHVCIKNKASWQLNRVHHHLSLHRGYMTNLLGDYLVMALAKSGFVEAAVRTASLLSKRSVFSWTAIISAYADCGSGMQSLQMYQRMLNDGVSPNSFTYVGLFKACASISDLSQGKSFHMAARDKGFISEPVVCNTLISMYGKCGALVEAEEVFKSLGDRSIVSWTAMLSAYVDCRQGMHALMLYRQMRESGVELDRPALGMAIMACRVIAEDKDDPFVMSQPIKVMLLDIGHGLHADVNRNGYGADVLVLTNLMRMYAECGAVAETEYVFNSMTIRDEISWTAMLSAYLKQGEPDVALQLYQNMRVENVEFDHVMLFLVLQACSERGNLVMCQQAHFDIVTSGYDVIPSIASSLIHGYGNCASMSDMEVIFSKHPEPDIVAWNAHIAGHVEQGNITTSLELFEKLKTIKVKPDETTYILVLSACSHAGLVAKGIDYFDKMKKDHGLVPRIKHYNMIIDLLGRAGDFESIETVLQSMPMHADVIIWLCILCACHTHGNVEFARRAFNCAINLQPNQAFAYMVMSKIYVDVGLHMEAQEVEKLRFNAVELGKYTRKEDFIITDEHQLYSRVRGVCKHIGIYQIRKTVEDELIIKNAV